MWKQYAERAERSMSSYCGDRLGGTVAAREPGPVRRNSSCARRQSAAARQATETRGSPSHKQTCVATSRPCAEPVRAQMTCSVHSAARPPRPAERREVSLSRRRSWSPKHRDASGGSARLRRVRPPESADAASGPCTRGDSPERGVTAHVREVDCARHSLVCPTSAVRRTLRPLGPRSPSAGRARRCRGSGGLRAEQAAVGAVPAQRTPPRPRAARGRRPHRSDAARSYAN